MKEFLTKLPFGENRNVNSFLPLILISALGIVIFIAFTNTADFSKNALFSQLFGKPKSKASQIQPATKVVRIETVPGEILLKFKPEVSSTKKTNVRQEFGISIDDSIPRLGIEKIKVAAEARDKLIAKLNNNPSVEFAEANVIGQLAAIPNDPAFVDGQWYLQKIGAPTAWDISKGNGVTVAVVDTGINLIHEDLKDKIVNPYNVVNDTTAVDDTLAHGTAAAGIIGATTDNLTGIAGSGWNVKIMPIKVDKPDGKLDAFYAAKGIDRAVSQNVRIINFSLIFPLAYAQIGGLPTAIHDAYSKGSIIVAVGGNQGEVPVIGSFAADLAYPCLAGDETLCVGATDQNDNHPVWSSGGSKLDVVAPGVGFATTIIGGDNLYAFGAAGSSFSGPLVTGVAALILAVNPNLTNTQVMSILKDTALDLGDPGPDSTFGWGRIQADRAVQMAQQTLTACVHLEPSISLSPADQWGKAGEGLAYNVTITNNDTSLCPAATLQESSTLPPTLSDMPTPTPTPSPAPDLCPTGLISYWKLNETTGATTALDSQDSNNGAINSVTFAAGKINNAGSFNGTASNISITSSGFPAGASSRTVSAWVQTTSTDLQEVLSYGTGATGQVFTVGVWGGQIFISSWASPQYTVSAPNVNNGSWHHIAVTYDGINASTYMDGILLDTRAFAINTVLGTAYIGSRVLPLEFFNGQIDEVGIWNRALTDAEVSQLYNGGIGVTCGTAPTPTPTPVTKINVWQILTGFFNRLAAVAQASTNITLAPGASVTQIVKIYSGGSAPAGSISFGETVKNLDSGLSAQTSANYSVYTGAVPPATYLVQIAVTNDNGGNALPSDFSFSLDGGAAQSFEPVGENKLTVQNDVSHTVNLGSLPAGYTLISTTPACTSAIIPSGGTATCTFSVDDDKSFDTIPPSVSITLPANGVVVSGRTSISVAASDNLKVAKVELYIDNKLYTFSEFSPYNFIWDTTKALNGSHSLLAKAYDMAGNIATSSTVAVTVQNDTTAPTVSITNPVNGAAVSGAVTISADAVDNVGVTRVAFLVDGGSIGTDTSAPYAVFWDTTIYPHNSLHTILANALDTSGNQASSSAVLVTVLDVIPPNISITNPINGSTVPKNSTVTITANASDISGINKVEFYVNGVLKCADTTSSYSCNWKVPPRKNVVYTVLAKAFDVAGNTNTSTVTVTSK